MQAATHRRTYTVSAIGLGAMPLSTKEDRPSPSEAEAVVHAALDAGVTLIDTADAYATTRRSSGTTRSWWPRPCAVRPGPDVLVATKGGHTRPGGDWDLDGSPAYLRRACEASLRRLHVDAIGLYQFHRPDPATPWEESMARCGRSPTTAWCGWSASPTPTCADRRAAGDRRRLRQRAEPVLARLALLGRRDRALRRARAGVPPVEPVRRGVVGRSLDAAAPAFAEVAAELGVSVYQVTLAWHLAQADVVVPIPGASRPASIVDSAAAADLVLSPDQLARLQAG